MWRVRTHDRGKRHAATYNGFPFLGRRACASVLTPVGTFSSSSLRLYVFGLFRWPCQLVRILYSSTSPVHMFYLYGHKSTVSYC